MSFVPGGRFPIPRIPRTKAQRERLRRQAEDDRILRKAKAEERGQRPGVLTRLFRAITRRNQGSS